MFCAYGLWLRVYKIGFHFVRNTLSSYLLFICIVAILMSFECVTWLRKNQSLRNRNLCRFQCPREIVISCSNLKSRCPQIADSDLRLGASNQPLLIVANTMWWDLKTNFEKTFGEVSTKTSTIKIRSMSCFKGRSSCNINVELSLDIYV